MAPSSEIIGHARQQMELLRDIKTNSLSHAYLFAGQKHLGKFTVARWFIGELLVQGKTEEAAEQMRTLVRKNTHPDILILDQLWIDGVCTDWKVIAKSSTVPQEHRAKDPKAKTDVIGIDDIKAIQNRLWETPQGNHMCCLIRDIERLSEAAANALLKILEEPPPHVLFCCTTESLGSIPKTVISRCRLLHFSPSPQSELEPLVQDVPKEDRALLLRVAQGAPGIIFRCLSDADHLRAERQARIDARLFLEGTSVLDRLKHLRQAVAGDSIPPLFCRQLFLQLQEQLRSDKRETALKARERLIMLLRLLRLLESNTSRPLLMIDTALSFP